MQLVKSRIEGMLENGRKGFYDSFALHGTAALSVISLFENSFLPTGKSEGVEGRLFFVPVDLLGVLRNLTTNVGWPKVHDNLTGIDLAWAIKDTKHYATITSDIIETAKIIEEMSFGPRSSMLLAEAMTNGGKLLNSISEDEWNDIGTELLRKSPDSEEKGVVVSVNSRIAELGIRLDRDGGGVFVFAPHGLGAEYIDGIAPLTNADNQLILECLKRLE